MKKKEAADAPADPWKKKLQESLKSGRPSTRRWGLWMGIALVLVLGFVTFLLFPRPIPPLPPLVTFDVVVRAGAPASVAAMFELPADPQAIPPLEGRRVIFQESRLPVPGVELSRADVTLGEDRAARAELPLPAGFSKVAFEALCPGRGKQAGVKDQAHAFALPAESRLLVVSVEGTLARAGLKDWETGDLAAIAAVGEASSALMAAKRNGFELIYLALEADRPMVYRHLRQWTSSRFGAGSLPEGPVLGRPAYPGSAEASYAGVLSALKEGFAEGAAVTADPAIARRFQAAGWRTILVGAAEVVDGVDSIASWEEVARTLAVK